MAKYIEREAAEKVFSNARKHMKPENYTGQEFFIRDNILLNAEQIVHAIPAADVVEVRHGRWVHGREVGREYLGDCLVGIFYDRWTCSECGYVVDDHEYSGINYKFCPNCGAKMKGGVNE